MAEPLEIVVTAEDIEAALADDGCPACRCPVARAMARALDRDLDDEEVVVHGDRVNIDGALYSLPQVVADFVFDFDTSEGVSPFAFRFTWEDAPLDADDIEGAHAA